MKVINECTTEHPCSPVFLTGPENIVTEIAEWLKSNILAENVLLVKNNARPMQIFR